MGQRTCHNLQRASERASSPGTLNRIPRARCLVVPRRWDFPASDFCELSLYQNLEELESSYSETVRAADVVVVGSYTPDGIAVGHWVQRTALGLKVFYDIDTPVTLAQLNAGSCTYLSPDLIPDYDLYLSFTGGPTLEHIERQLGSPCARVLYCSVDPSKYFPQTHSTLWELGYLGTYSVDRQPTLDALLVQSAMQRPESRFAVAGAQYPPDLSGRQMSNASIIYP